MEKILFAADELTGLIGAAALMRPSKSCLDMELSSLKKKFKDKKFAAGCSRDVIKTGAERLGRELDKLMEMKSTDSADMRTAGGVSSEVIRTPDIIFAFWATTQDIANNTMKILSMPCRFNKPFPEIKVYVDLGTCQFISVDE